MRRAALSIGLAAVAAVAGCAQQPHALPDAPQWLRVASTLAGRYDPSSPNACDRGATGCVDAVVAEMTTRFVPLARSCSHLAPFALMYLRVTQAVDMAPAGAFHDPRYVAHLDAVFAQLYFTAESNWSAGRSPQVPGAWRIAFGAAADRTVSALGDMMLGMNAHISHDLAVAVAETGADPRDKADFDRVNTLLVRLQPEIVSEAAARWDPAVATTTIPGLGRQISAAQVFSRWRDEAWANGVRLARAPSPTARARIEAEIDRTAANRALLIRAATGYLDLRHPATSRDAYCRSRVDRATTGREPG